MITVTTLDSTELINQFPFAMHYSKLHWSHNRHNSCKLRVAMETKLHFFPLIKHLHETRCSSPWKMEKRKTCWNLHVLWIAKHISTIVRLLRAEKSGKGKTNPANHTQKKGNWKKKCMQTIRRLQQMESLRWNFCMLDSLSLTLSRNGWMFIWIKYDLAKNELYEADKSHLFAVMFERIKEEVFLLLDFKAFIINQVVIIIPFHLSLLSPAAYTIRNVLFKLFRFVNRSTVHLPLDIRPPLAYFPRTTWNKKARSCNFLPRGR